MDWLDLLAVQGTLKNLLQHQSSKASILWHSAFFIVQLSHPYMTTGKTIALTRRNFVGKVMSLLLNMLSGLVIDYSSLRKLTHPRIFVVASPPPDISHSNNDHHMSPFIWECSLILPGDVREFYWRIMPNRKCEQKSLQLQAEPWTWLCWKPTRLDTKFSSLAAILRFYPPAKKLYTPLLSWDLLPPVSPLYFVLGFPEYLFPSTSRSRFKIC